MRLRIERRKRHSHAGGGNRFVLLAIQFAPARQRQPQNIILRTQRGGLLIFDNRGSQIVVRFEQCATQKMRVGVRSTQRDGFVDADQARILRGARGVQTC